MHEASGALVGSGAVLSGGATRAHEHRTTGALVGAGAVLAAGPPKGRRVHVVGGDGVLEAFHRNRTGKSTQKRRELAQKARTGASIWLDRAYQENPRLGAERLARRARQLLSVAQEQRDEDSRNSVAEKKERKGVSTHRAREFLRVINTKSSGA